MFSCSSTALSVYPSPGEIGETEVGWAGAGEGLGSPCVTLPSVWKQTDCSLPQILLCTWPQAPAPSVHRGQRLLLPEFGFPWPGKELWPCQTEQGAWNGQTWPGMCRGITGSQESKVQLCLDLDLGAFPGVFGSGFGSLPCSCASQRLLMGSVCPVGPDVRKVPWTCQHSCSSPQITSLLRFWGAVVTFGSRVRAGLTSG